MEKQPSSGEQFARCLSGAGARVILAARHIDKLNALAAELNIDSTVKAQEAKNIILSIYY
jgi:NADP-dependent 3-hydroxy acid dehydrogenase YdfG